MPRPLRSLFVGLVAAALLALAHPTVSMAQSAGDQQYADPLAQPDDGNDQPDPPPEQNSQGNSGSSGSQSPSTPSDSAPARETTPQAAQGQAELPRTGYPAWLAALAGGVLLASGATLRISLGLRR